MNLSSAASRADDSPGYPRYFRIAGQWVSSYKVFLCVGIYLGILVIAALAQSSGIPPLRVGLGSLALAIIGLAGARVYHLLVYHALYFGRTAGQSVWNFKDGGLSVFGALLAMAPCTTGAIVLIREFGRSQAGLRLYPRCTLAAKPEICSRPGPGKGLQRAPYSSRHLAPLGIAVRSAADLATVAARPHPRLVRRSVRREEDAADNLAVLQDAIVLLVLADRVALEDEQRHEAV
jgi:hypothetical protein